MSKRQDYIARIRYQNDLPPPPCGPKLLNHDIDLSGLLTAGSMSTAVLSRDVNVEVDVDLGMPIDLTQVPYAFSETSAEREPVELDPEDRELLVEPSATGSSRSSSAGPGVSFLRRTEYMTSDLQRQKRAEVAVRNTRDEPEQVLQRIDQAFESAQAPLDSLKHPKKKGIHAVKAYPLFPDTSQLDLQFVTVHMTGSASLRNLKTPLTPAQLDTAVFNSISVGPEDDEDEWVGMFVPETDQEATELRKRLRDQRDHLTAEEAGAVSRMTLVQENDIDYQANKTDFDEIAITVDDDAAYYVPVVGRTNLKRRRVAALKRHLVEEAKVDVVELALRDLSAEESMERDSARARFDPVTYH